MHPVRNTKDALVLQVKHPRQKGLKSQLLWKPDKLSRGYFHSRTGRRDRRKECQFSLKSNPKSRLKWHELYHAAQM